MALLTKNVMTLADYAKRKDPSGKIAKIVEMLSQNNPILEDMMFREGNLETGHRTTIRTGLPEVFWRMLNQGVQPSKSQTAQITENCGMLEAWSEMDEELGNLNGNVNATRLSEASAFIEAMGQEHASTLFYGNSSLNPEQFNGLSVRYSSLAAANGRNIIDAGGTGSDNASIWLINWGEESVHGIFPKGSKAGISHKDLGLQTVETTNGIGGARMLAYRDQWKLKTGLALKDWRSVVRIANIDVSNLAAGGETSADLVKFMIQAMHKIDKRSGRKVFYMNDTVFQYLDIQRRQDALAGGVFKVDEGTDGSVKHSFRGVPVKGCDALLETEARVV